MTVMAKSRVESQGQAWGREETVASLAQETSYIRRRISGACVKAFGQRLTSRMCQVGEGAGLASKRRQQWGREEDRARLDRETVWLGKMTGQNIVRKGRFWHA